MRRFDREYQRALENYERIRRELEEAQPNLNVEKFLPFMPELELESVDGTTKPLYGSYDALFLTRNDYERSLRYLERFNREAEQDWQKSGYATLSGVSPTSLTSVYVDDEGKATTVSAFRQRESQLRINDYNRQAIDALKEKGINIVRTPVVTIDEDTGIVKPLRRGGKPVTQFVAETPEQQRNYEYAIQQEGNLRVIQPNVPEDAYMYRWGDIVEIDGADRPSNVMGNAMMGRWLKKDEQLDNQTALYFSNMKNIIDSTMPDTIASKLDGVFEQILREPPEVRHRIYRIMSGRGGDDIGAEVFNLEFLYLGTGTDAATRIMQVYNNIRDKVLPLLSKSVDMPDDYSADDSYEQLMSELDVDLANAGSIAAKFKELRKHGVSTIGMSELRRIRGRG